MDDPLLPWWSVLLVGMWAVALTVWMYPSAHREVRYWAGLSTLVYLALIFISLGGNPFARLPISSSQSTFRITDALVTVCVGISLSASVWMLAPVTIRSQRLCYVIFTLMNVVICGVMHQPGIAIGLLVVTGLAARPLVKELSRNGIASIRSWIIDFTAFNNEPPIHRHHSEFWLIGTLAAVLSLAILGTVSYALRIESQRVNASPRNTALPSRDQLQRIVSKESVPALNTSLIDLALGIRADVLVLLVVIVFLKMAMTLAHRSRPILAGSADTTGIQTIEGEGADR